MSRHYEKIKTYYLKGLYKVAHLDKFLSAGAITQEEYDELIALKAE